MKTTLISERKQKKENTKVTAFEWLSFCKIFPLSFP